MKKVKTVDLKVGQVFSQPVYTEGDNLLVPEMIPIRQKDLDILTTWGITFVATDGELVELEPEPDEPEEIIDEIDEIEEIDEAAEVPETTNANADEIDYDAEISQKAAEYQGGYEYDGYDNDQALKVIEAELAEVMASMDINFDSEEDKQTQEENVVISSPALRFSISDVRQNSGPYRVYKRLIEKLNSLFTGLKAGSDIEMRMIDHVCVQLLQDLRENPDSFVGFILGGEVAGSELAKSSVNTAILSALVAQEMKLPNHKIHNIVAGALLHDVGMLRLSKGITEKKGGLSEAELEQIKSHPLHTSKIVTKELYGPREVNLIALQHHERWDGQGYPDMLEGQAIDIGARIVSVADAFEAMVSKKSYRAPILGYQAIKNLMADNARRFDPAVIIAFTKIMGIYPIGSIVRLNNSSIARVIKIQTDAPMRPTVQLLRDQNGNVLGSGNIKTIDLLTQRTLFIKEAIDPADFAE